MDQVIRILHLEDNAVDIELVQSTLESVGMACQISQVQSCDEFTDALRKGGFDVILADYRLPTYDGMSALRLVQELGLDIPFIFVSGTMGEEAAIEGLTQGATDYVLKQKLSRLAPAVKRALHEAENQRERKRNEAINASRLHLVQFSLTHSLDELLEETLNETEKLTGSLIGFYHFVDDDQKSLLLQNWSTRTKSEFCTAKGKGLHYAISEAGVWVDCVYQRKPVIHNDYASLPHRKGMPEGHAAVSRELVVPVFRGEKIRAILGVGNKPTDYTQQDIKTVSLLADLAWEIAERKRAEESVRRAKEYWERTFDAVPDLVAILDTNFHIVQINKAMADRLNLTPHECMGQICYKLVHGTEKPPSSCPHALSLNDGLEHIAEVREERLGGDFIVSTSPILESDGRMISCVHVARDITERKRAEDALRESETRFRTLVEGIPDPVLIHDDEGTILYINAIGAAQLEWSAKDLIGKNLLEIVSSEEKVLIADHIRETHKAGWCKFETTYITRSGWKIIAEVNDRPIKFGKDKAILRVSRDITDRKQIEEALRASEEQFRQFFENEPEYCYMISTEGLILNVNNAALSALGYTKEELVGKPLQTIYAPESVPKMEQLYSKWKKTGQLKDEEVVIITKKGERRTVLLSAGAVKDSDGKILHSISVQKDITERKNIEDALRESEERFRKVVETMRVGLATVDENSILTYVNEYFSSMIGYSVDEMVGHDPTDFYYDEEGRRAQKEIFEKRKRGMRDAPTHEVSLRTKDGRKVYSILTPTPFFDAEGRYQGSSAIHTDITERKQIEGALRESEEKYRELINGMNDTAWVIDFEGNFIDVNNAAVEVLGYSREELLSMGPHDIDNTLDAEEIRVLIKEMPTNKIQIFETTHTTKDGKTIPVEIKSSLVTYQGERAILSIARDITERKQAEEALKESEEKFRNLAEQSPNMIFINAKKRIVYANEKCTEITGYTREEFYAPDFDFWTLIAPESIDLIKKLYGKHMKGEEVPPYEYTLITKEGRRIEAINATKLIQYAGEHALLGIVTDISERKKAEQELHHSYQQMQEMLVTVVNALASTVEMKDQYTAGHQQRVTQLACAIAEEMGLSEEQVEGIRMAGLIHDIGKIMVPAEILNKPGPLTEIQYEMVKMHSRAGYDILKDIKFPWPVAQMVLQHHERMDGSGYPQGLSGEEILLEARILAVANVVEAMVSHRPYRAAYDIKEALAEISKNKGILYDPVVADACLKLFTEEQFTFD
jgi:PAS domain S-box-containing protein/putative nucleotidyltransferase with HDIG domain